MFEIKKLLACGAIIAGLLAANQAFAATAGKCLSATPDDECFNDLVLDVGGSTVIDIDKPTKQMKFVTSDDKVIDVRPFKEDKLYIRGKEVGHGTLTVFDQSNGKTVAKIEVTVKNMTTIIDLTNLKKRFAKVFPGQDINVEASQNGIVLSGTVTGAEVAEQVVRLAEGYISAFETAAMTSEGNILQNDRSSLFDATNKKVTIGQGGTIITEKDYSARTGRSDSKIINLLKIGGPQQVLLEVKFAEVNRDSAKELQAGFTLSGLGSDFRGGVGVNPFSAVESILNGTQGNLGVNQSLQPNVFLSIDNFALWLRFVEEERLGRVLAEPKLVTMSGQEASFLAGGEYPYQTVDDDEVNIEFKEFGVGLRFTPIVGSDGMITLKVSPSVSDIIGFTDERFGTYSQPILTTRRLDSMVQLRDGQTLALAGLLSDKLINTVSKVPLLGDIPILGALFRSTEFEQKKTDLLIAVTPHLVKPGKEGQINYPGQYVTPPNRFELYLEGKLEGRRAEDEPSKLSGHNFVIPATASGGGLEGNFGHMESAR